LPAVGALEHALHRHVLAHVPNARGPLHAHGGIVGAAWPQPVGRGAAAEARQLVGEELALAPPSQHDDARPALATPRRRGVLQLHLARVIGVGVGVGVGKGG